jgi:hypothetical protein
LYAGSKFGPASAAGHPLRLAPPPSALALASTLISLTWADDNTTSVVRQALSAVAT